MPLQGAQGIKEGGVTDQNRCPLAVGFVDLAELVFLQEILERSQLPRGFQAEAAGRVGVFKQI